MGYMSNAMIGIALFDEDRSYPSRPEILQYFWEDLSAKLEELDEQRPHDPLDPEYDKFFCADGIVHYYENPSTVQDILFGLREIETLLLECDAEDQMCREVHALSVLGTSVSDERKQASGIVA